MSSSLLLDMNLNSHKSDDTRMLWLSQSRSDTSCAIGTINRTLCAMSQYLREQ